LSRRKLEAAAQRRGHATGKTGEWLLRQEAHAMHKPARKKFPKNPYTVNNVGDLCDLDLEDMLSLGSHNDGHKYILNAIDASNYVYSIPTSSNTGQAFALAIRTILA
jgi:hypothetical protein